MCLTLFELSKAYNTGSKMQTKCFVDRHSKEKPETTRNELPKSRKSLARIHIDVTRGMDPSVSHISSDVVWIFDSL